MRHLGSLIAAIVIGPLAWVLIAFGQDRSAVAFANGSANGALHTHDFIRPLIFLAAAGIILGLIATLRFSPLGVVLAGAVYAASYVALLINPRWLSDLLGYTVKIAGEKGQVMTPVRTGTTLILGALMLVAAVSLGRWRRPAGTAPTPAAESFATPAPLGSTEPSGTDKPADGGESIPEWPSETTETAGPAEAGTAGSPWESPLREGSDSSPR